MMLQGGKGMLTSFLQGFKGLRRSGVAMSFPDLAPTEPLCLIGDIHGRADLLEQFIRLRAARFPYAKAIYLGDMIDRGPESRAVLMHLRDQEAEGAICLCGNHEEMLLAFLDRPQMNRGWLMHGGYEFCQSWGVTPNDMRPEGLTALSRDLANAMGQDMILWLRARPLYWQSGNLVACHAGMDPDLAPADQSRSALLWGHSAFGRMPRGDGLWVAYGHVVAQQAFSKRGCISLDTGAYATGRLSFALIDPGLAEHERLQLAEVRL